jgi:urea carboxylase
MVEKKITKLLIANRGEISVRAQRACAVLGLPCVAVFTSPDALSLHVLNAPESVCLGDTPKEYLNADRLLEVAAATGADAVFPGYGFLSENAEFAERCEAAGIAFLGPTGETMRAFAQKHTARALAEGADVPILPGTSLLSSGEEALEAARRIGLPVLLKATGGGGGIGIHICRTEDEVVDKFNSAARQGAAAFGDAGVFVEKYVQHARHIEVQIFGDGQGNVVTFPERECSIQRRHQKVLEETPSPFVNARPDVRKALQAAAASLASAIKYRSAGTVEFILDDETGEFYFLEVNTRLQVEHGITEMVAGVDLVAWMLQLQGAVAPADAAPGVTLPSDLSAFSPGINGAAIEVRVCAEDPAHGYRPCTGILGEVAWPSDVRVDTWVETGSEVPAYYDSLLAKVMVHSSEGRPAAIAAMAAALEHTRLSGVTTNMELLRDIVAAPGYAAGATTTKFLEDFTMESAAFEVIDAGLLTTVQDYPGRIKLWSVGVPPSGPMDDLSHRLANALVGNDDKAAALEITLAGPTLKFLASRVVAVCGASAAITVDGAIVPQWCSFAVSAGQTLKIGAVDGGARTYLAVSGGIDVPLYLGSRSTFPGGKLGGHQGRALRVGDMIPLAELDSSSKAPVPGTEVPSAWRPSAPAAGASWEVAVLPGPQADPDYFTTEDISTFYSTEFKVHHNSNRLGIRLDGPRPEFARPDGGEGGSHPSNVHDHVYAIGTINYTGDMPVILGPDGPSLGGAVRSSI